MRRGLYCFADALGFSAAAGTTVASSRAAMGGNRATNLCRIGLPPCHYRPSSFGQRFFAPLAIYQLFHELHALEIQKLLALLLASVKRHADLPGPCEDVGILDCRFVRDHIRTTTSVTLDHVERVAMKIPRAVEPGLVVETGHVDYQGVSLPVADGLTHPGVDGRRPRILEQDIAFCAGVLAGDQDLALGLKDSEGLRNVRCARDSRQVALDLRIAGQPVLLVLLPLDEGLRFVTG